MDEHRLRRAREIFRRWVEEQPGTRHHWLEGELREESPEIHDAVFRLIRAFEEGDSGDSQEHTETPPWLSEPSIPVSAAEDSSDRIPGFRLLDTLGEGGMGVVFLAEQGNPRRRVALKVLAPMRGTWRRFEQEAEALGRLRHPCIAQIFAAGVSPSGEPFIAMEYVPNARTPLEYADAEALGIRERLELLARICEGVQHAHQRGVIHRDIKPDNVLVDEDGCPKIVDFGIARLVDHEGSRATHAGQIVGTLTYMSPEQAGADPDAIDTRTDVYGLGALGYELLSGQAPIDLEGLTPLQGVRRISQEAPKSLGAVDRRLRGDIETILAKALSKEADRRYASAQALADDVRRYLSREPIQARRPSLFYVCSRFIGRHQTVSAAALLIIVTIVTALVVTLRALEERIEESKRRNAAVLQYEEERRKLQRAEIQNDSIRRKLIKAQSLLRLNVVAKPGDLKGNERPSSDSENASSVLELVGASRAPTDRRRLSKQGSMPLERAFPLVQNEDTESAAEEAFRFVQVLFLSATPEFGWRDYRFQDVLDFGEELLRQQKFERPETEAEIRGLLGSTHRYFGEYERAERLLLGALALEIELPENSRRVLTNRKELAILYLEQQRFEEAEAILDGLLPRFEAAFGPSHGYTIACLATEGSLRSVQGKLAEAAAIYREALARLGPETDQDRLKLTLLSNLGDTLLKLGRLEEADAVFRDALAFGEKRLGAENPILLSCQGNYGALLIQNERFDEAERLLAGTQTAMEHVLGPDHPDRAYALNSLGMAQSALGSLRPAESSFREAIRIREARLDSSHPELLSSRSFLAQVLLTCSRDRISEPGQRTEAVAAAEQQYGLVIKEASSANHLEQSPDLQNLLATALYNRALLYEEVGRQEEAEPDLRASIRWRENLFGSGAVRTFSARYKLGNVLAHLGRFEEARAVLEHARAERDGAEEAVDSQWSLCTQALAGVYEHLGSSEESRRLIEDLYERQVEKLGAQHPETLYTATNLVQVLRGKGDLERAEEVGRAALAGLLEADESEPFDVEQARVRLAEVLLERARAPKAESPAALLKEAADLIDPPRRWHRGYFGAEHERTLAVEAVWIRIALAQDRAEAGLEAAQDLVEVARRSSLGVPVLANYLELLGDALEQYGQPDKAIAHFEEAEGRLRSMGRGNEESIRRLLEKQIDLHERAGATDAAARCRARLDG